MATHILLLHGIQKQKKIDFSNFESFQLGGWPPQNFSDPFISEKKKSFGLQGSWYSNRPAQSHGFNAKIGFEKYATSPKIIPKNCPKSAFQTKPVKVDTFWPISREAMLIFQKRFLH